MKTFRDFINPSDEILGASVQTCRQLASDVREDSAKNLISMCLCHLLDFSMRLFALEASVAWVCGV